MNHDPNNPSDFITRPIDLFYIEQVQDIVIEHYSDIISQSGTILDFGCGWGEKTESFRRTGIKAFGIDVDKNKIKLAKQNYGNCCFQVAKGESLPFQENYFDGLFSCSTLQYVNVQSALKEIKRVLKSKGKAVLIENLAGNPVALCFRYLHRILNIKYGKYLTPQKHLDFRTIEELKFYFDICDMKFFNLFTPLAIIIPTLHMSLTGNKAITIKPDKVYKILSKLDTLLLTVFPSLKKYCWTVFIKARF